VRETESEHSMDYADRRVKLRGMLPEKGVSAFLVASPENVLYLSGFTGGESWLLLTGQRVILLTDFRYREQAEKEAPDVEIVVRGSDSLAELAAKVVPERCELGFESTHLSHAEALKLGAKVGEERLAAVENAVEQLREIKGSDEVDLIRRCIAVAEESFLETRELIVPGMSERDIATELVYRMRKRGAQGEAFPVIVAFGERSSLPHAPCSDRRLEAGEAILIDWGARSGFYNCDLTRVLFVDSIPASFRPLYDVVLAAQQEAFEASRPGKPLGAIDAAARSFITQAGYGEQFGHALGHGIGLEVHERPTVRSGVEEQARPGMVHTIEPGIYLPDVGGVRIEDMVLVAEPGGERITSLPREIDEMVI